MLYVQYALSILLGIFVAVTMCWSAKIGNETAKIRRENERLIQNNKETMDRINALVSQSSATARVPSP